MRLVIQLSRKISLLFLPILGVIVILWVNAPFGMGVAHDSMFYISMAKHMAAGKGAFVFMSDISTASGPLTRYCPGLSVIMAVFFLFKVNIATTILILNGVLFGLNIFLVSGLIFRVTKSYLAGFFTGWIFLISPIWQSAHSWILTEPLYLFLTNLSIWLFWEYFNKKRDLLLLLSALFTGLGCVTRYTGISYCFAGALCLWFFLDCAPWQRFKKALLFGVISCAPFFLWLTRNIIRSYKPNTPISTLAFGDIGTPKDGIPFSFYDYTLQSVDAFFEWLSAYAYLPLRMDTGPGLWLFLVVIALITWLYHKKNSLIKSSFDIKFPFIVGTYALVYIIFLILYLKLSEQKIPMDQRYMMIFYSYLILLFVFSVHWLWKNKLRACSKPALYRSFLGLGAFIFLVWSLAWLTTAYQWMDKTRKIGADNTKGFSWAYVNSRRWLPTK